MLKRIVIIENAQARRGRTSRPRIDELIPEVCSQAKEHGIEPIFEFVQTTAAGQACRTGQFLPGTGSYLARQAVESGADIVVAAGGDGTVCEVANGLLGRSAVLGVLPCGTGNDFARTLGIGTDMALAMRTLAFGESRMVDVGKCGQGHFVNVAGCGFDAQVAHRINHGFRRLRGTTAYIAATLTTLRDYRPTPVRLTIDGITHEQKIMLCAIANARSYGGGMRIAPNADLFDGMFDLIVVGELSKFAFLKAFPNVFRGTHISHPSVTVLRCRNVQIESESPIPVLADGEELSATPVSFEVVPKALSVMFPKI